MKISSYEVTAQAQRSYVSVESTTSVLKQTQQQPAAVEENTADAKSPADQLSLSDLAKQMMEKAKEQRDSFALSLQTGRSSGIGFSSSTAKNPLDVKLQLLEQMMFSLSGRRMRFQPFYMGSRNGGSQGINLNGLRGFGNAGNTSAASQISTEHFQYEAESVSYQAQGLIQTADGKSISVDVSMHMSREFVSHTSTTTNIKLCDPLVINYAGTAASLSGESFEFDLDADGKMDNIFFAGEGQGFLALDKNGDGKINDGNELFGPQSGSGFGELRSYDQDSNGWIDENDEVFSQLRIWGRDKDGNDQLFTLKELDIGAIYLGDVETEFSLKDEANNTQGVVRSTSFFLKESGGAGTISHIDLSV